MIKIIICVLIAKFLWFLLWNEFWFRHNVLKLRRYISHKIFKTYDPKFIPLDENNNFWNNTIDKTDLRG
jgi:hypothetical protein